MKFIYFLLSIFFCYPLSGSAQTNHFVYFQTENKQPFYIKTENKILNSSSAGYLIIPKLKDGNYIFTVGFPKQEWPEEKINVKVDKDAGYVLKNFEEKGWGAFNLQNFEIIMRGNESAADNISTQVNKDDAFSNMLATVVNDSTIRQKDVVREKPKEIPVAKKEDVIKEDVIDEPINSLQNSDSTSTEIKPANSVVSRKLLEKNKDGIEMIYIDEFNQSKDTIRIFMPVELTDKVTEIAEKNVAEEATVSNQTDTTENTPATLINEPAVDDAKLLADDTKYTFIEDTKDSISVTSPGVNSNCNGYASEEDFLKLRKKMAAEDNNEDMIKVAKKFFKSKCFSTDFIKNLSSLFLNDEGKYNFFDTAYPFVSDSGLYYTLESLLTDNYYVNRFKAMVHH